MTEDTAQLTESFAAHEHLVPDPADVLARANAIARSYQRRRWAVRATGTAVVGAGLVAGGIALPGWVGESGSRQVVSPANGHARSATPTDDSPTWTRSQEMSEFLTSGYTYADAQQLATLWKDDRTLSKVKADAGLKLLQGASLPIPPSGTPESPAQQAMDAYFAAGYGYDDAVALGTMWHETDITQVKTEAGQKLMAGQPLPIPPSETSTTPGGGTDPTDPQTEADFQAYFNAGYDYDDAVALGKVWNETDTGQIKAEAGQKLLDGETLPVPPSGTPATPDDKAIQAFFNAGYTYDDAVALGQRWHETNITHVKAEAGQKLLDGQTLPIAP